MLIAISVNHAAHQKQHCQALAEGFDKHGIKWVMTPGDTVVEGASFHCTWSIKRPNILAWSKRTGKPYLCLERGHVGDRMSYTSMGWNGLGARGTYARVDDGGARWQKYWQHLLQPWKPYSSTSQVALVLGQVPGDSSLYGLTEGFPVWAQTQTDQLRARGYAVIYRRHPLVVRWKDAWCPTGATLSTTETIWEDLRRADLAVSYNSTAGVEAVLAGVPTVTLDAGAMAYDVSAHDLGVLVKPDRTDWVNWLAWTQFCLAEIRDGSAWEAVGAAYPTTTKVSA